VIHPPGFVRCVAVLVLAASLAAGVDARQRGPSTPEERARAVQLAKKLRTDPLAAGLEKDRQWLVKWLIEVPDINVKLCSAILADVGHDKKGYSAALLAAMLASQAAFVIENPDKAKDEPSEYLAGTEGALDAYEAITKSDPSYHLPQLEVLRERRAQGELRDFVAATAREKCKS
jgi:hypothetical protein